MTQPEPDENVPSLPPRPSFARRWISPLLKLLIAGGLLYYVFAYKVDDKDKTRLADIFVKTPHILILAVIAFSMQILIGAQRLRLLLRPQEVHISYWRALKLTYLGAFFDTFMITSVGGDAVKAFYLARDCEKEKRLGAVSVLVLDRLLGLLGLLSLTVLMTLWNIRQLHADETIGPFVIWLFIVPALLLIGTLMLLSDSVRNWGPMQGMLRTIPLGGTINKAYGSLQRFRDRPLILLYGWLLSLVVHMCGVITGYILVLGLQERVEIGPFCVAWFISGFVTSFAPFGGVGTGQYLYELVFRKIVELPQGMGIILATTVQVTVVLAKAPGFIAWIMMRKHPHEPGVQGPPAPGIQTALRPVEASAVVEKGTV
jgi:uncharacterized membrane protein YbhN (UPF0104 family)